MTKFDTSQPRNEHSHRHQILAEKNVRCIYRTTERLQWQELYFRLISREYSCSKYILILKDGSGLLLG